MRIAVLSPHRDDAAFSCGLTMLAMLQSGAELTVFNVYTRSDYAVDLQTVDPSLPRVEAVSHARRLEDEHFVKDITAYAGRESNAVRLHDLDRLDAPLRLAVDTEKVLHSPLTDAEVKEQAIDLGAQFESLPAFDLVFAPLALGDHIDHRVVREAAKRCVAADRLCLYEDLPYVARLSTTERKQQAFHAIPSNGGAEFLRYGLHMPQGSHLKHRFAKHYPSQIAAEVASEMASYAARQSSGTTGAERWWAVSATGARVANLLHAAAVPCTLVEEQE